MIIKPMIKFMCSVENEFNKFFIQEFSPQGVLGACQLEDTHETTELEKKDLLLCLKYFFNGIPFNCNGLPGGVKKHAMYAAFSLVTTSQTVRKWIEEKGDNFGISLVLDLECGGYKLICSSIPDWMKFNDLTELEDN